MANKLHLTQKPGFLPVAALLIAMVGIAGGPRLWQMFAARKPPASTKKTVPAELVKLQQALKSQKYIHISLANNWDFWKAGDRVAFISKTRELPNYFFDGKKYTVYDNKIAIVTDQAREAGQFQPSTNCYYTLYFMNLSYWLVDKYTNTNNKLALDLFEVGLDPTTMEIEYDPKTGLPTKQTVIRNLTTLNTLKGTTVYHYDYKPFDLKIFSPRIPPPIPVQDFVTARAREEAALKTPLFTIPLEKGKLEIRRVRVNLLGDVFVDYTGPFPYTPPAPTGEVVTAGMSRPWQIVPGSIEVADSLGHTSASGKSQIYELPGTHGSNGYFLNLGNHPLEKSSVLSILHHGIVDDLRPRAITLRFKLDPVSGQGEPKVFTWTTPLITPSNPPERPSVAPVPSSAFDETKNRRRIQAFSYLTKRGVLPNGKELDALTKEFLAKKQTYVDWPQALLLYKLHKALGQDAAAHELVQAAKEIAARDPSPNKNLPDWAVAELSKPQ